MKRIVRLPLHWKLATFRAGLTPKQEKDLEFVTNKKRDRSGHGIDVEGSLAMAEAPRHARVQNPGAFGVWCYV